MGDRKLFGSRVLGPVEDRMHHHPAPKALRILVERKRQGPDVAVKDAGVGLQGLGVHLACRESLQVAGVETRQPGQRPRGDMPVLVVRVGVDLVRGV
jgi:hypothetical protein